MIYLTRYRADDPQKLPIEPSSKTHFQSLDEVKASMTAMTEAHRSPSMVIYEDKGIRFCFSHRRFS